MGLFGFGKKSKKKSQDEDAELKDGEVFDENQEDEEETPAFNRENGPWDVDDENAPDWDEYININSIYIPVIEGMELRLKASNATGEILGATVTHGSSSLELEAFAAPKTMGLWDDIRQELLDSNAKAEEVDGEFGKEVLLPVSVKGKKFVSRVVGVDGPRWLLRGIFTGSAAEESEEKTLLDTFFHAIVVNRGEEPLAPHDLIPMTPPWMPVDEQNDSAELPDDSDSSNSQSKDHIEKPDDPNGYGQQATMKTTLKRGPIFSEMR